MNPLVLLLLAGAALAVASGRSGSGGRGQSRVTVIRNEAERQAWTADMEARAEQQTVRYVLVFYPVDSPPTLLPAPDEVIEITMRALVGWDGPPLISAYPQVEYVFMPTTLQEIRDACGSHPRPGWGDDDHEAAAYWIDGQIRRPGKDSIQFPTVCKSPGWAYDGIQTVARQVAQG